MSTDPFPDIAFQQELGQPTHVELIYTEVRQGKAFSPVTATVENSLARLAYGKAGPYKDIESQTPPKIVPAISGQARNKYTIGANGSTTPQLLKSQRIAAEFNRLIRNNISQQSLGEFLKKQDGDLPTINPPFDTTYEVVDLGTPTNLPTQYAGLVFKIDDHDKILVGGYGNSPIGAIYELDVTRGTDGHIISVGTANKVLDAPYVDGGVAYHPSGVLFVCGWPNNIIHQYKRNKVSTAPDKTIDLNPLGVNPSVGSIGFVPIGYPGAGSVILIIWSAGTTYTATLIDDGLGTFDITNITAVETVPGGPEGFVYVPLGSELFPNPSMMVTEFSTGQVSAYELNTNGHPDISSRRIFITGLDNAEGAAIDPQTGDYIFSTFGGDNRFFLIRGQGDGGFVPPDPPMDPNVCQLPINGNFDAGIDNWIPAQPNGLIWDNVNGRVTVIGEGGYQAMTGLTPGKTMQLKFWYYWKLINKPTGAPDNWVDGSWGFQFLLRADAPDGPIIGEAFGYQSFDESGEVFVTGGPVPSSGIVYIHLKTKPYILNGDSYDPDVQFDKICLVQLYDDVCVAPITNVRTLVQWNGIPRRPVNIFNMLLRLTYRDPNDPSIRTTTDILATADGRLGTVTPVTCSNSNTCDFWKQNGDMGNPQSLITANGLNPATTSTLFNGQLANVETKENWLWAIPGSISGVVQDALISVWPDSSEGLLESIEIFILMQAVNPTEPTPADELYACAGPFQCDQDPAQSFDIVLRYTNNRGQAREFRTTFDVADLYQTTTIFPLSPRWDALTAVGGGVLGPIARWETAKFILDAIDGSGLDQCTDAVEFVANGKGKLNFMQKLDLAGRGSTMAACDAKIDIIEISKGVSTNEVQSIILPKPSGGHWTLQFRHAGQTETTANIPWNAGAVQVKNHLENLEMIGEGNVSVIGRGTESEPFNVEFIGLLGSRDFKLLKANGDSLIGASAAYATKLITGSLNERQTISKNRGINSSLVINFDNVQSVPIPFNASLGTMQAILEGISSIGAGNVSVTGNTTDRDTDYQGPWYVDFMGALAGQNVPTMDTQTTGYSVITNWQGGAGVNDLQKLTIVSSGGTFTIKAQHPTNNTSPVSTDPISTNADANQIKSRMLQAFDWLTNGDLIVTKLPSSNRDVHEWTVEFTGQWGKQAIDLLSVNNVNLRGASIIVAEVTKGAGSNERQKMNFVNVKGGTYRLQVTINGITGETPLIPWNASAEGIELALQGLSLFPSADDVSVEEAEINNQEVVASFIVTFHRRFGDVPTMTYTNNLLCVPITLADIGPPPYEYKLPECEDADNIYCSPGPLLCRPGEGDDPVAVEACCEPFSIRDSANVYREIILQRDLFDPNATKSDQTLTVRDMAVLKGLRPSQYNAYLRDFHTGLMRPIDITTVVSTKMSVILIATDLDTKATRERIGRELKRRPNILPSRMSWSHPSLQG